MAQLPSPHAPHPAAPASSSGELRSATTRPCPSCSTPVSINASICPACGDALPAHNKRIRCRRCGGRAAAALVVCPHCGRELQAAPPRLLTWGAPLLLILLFSAVLLAQIGGASPATWTQRQVGRIAALVESLGARLQPDITITTIPVVEDDAAVLVSQPQPTPAQVAAVAQPTAADAPATAAPPAAEATSSLEAAIPTATVTTAPTLAPSPTPAPPTATPTTSPTATAPPTATPTASATVTPTPSVAASATAATATTAAPTVRAAGAVTTARSTLTNTLALVATATPTPATSLALALPTPTPANLAPTATPNLYRIRAGDTLFELALANDISLEALLAANNLTEDDVFTIQPGDDILIPDPNATAAPAATAAPTPTPAPEGVTYTVRAGDTLMAIGLRFDVNIQRILEANGLTLTQARSLRPGQELIIPGPGDAAPTATSQPAPTTAPVAATTMPATGMRLDAPALRSPENGASVQCGASEQLAWGAVPFIQPNDVYVVHLGYVNGRATDGAEQVVWVLAQPRASNVTLWQLDDSLCGLAPFEFGRQWRWFVDVAEKAADGTLTAVSQPSATWGFTWQ